MDNICNNIIINIFGNYEEKEYLIYNNSKYHDNSNIIFEFTLIITLLIYEYFFIRNYKIYIDVPREKRELYFIKVLETSLLIAGIICLIYFQFKQDLFVGSPAI